jgi:long-chain acyl-CoA synthetase
VIVPIDKELSNEEIKNIIIDSEAKAFIYSDDYKDVAEYIKNSDATIHHFINMNNLPELITKGNNLINHGDKSVINMVIDNKALAAIIYTSGTTGAAKGVMLSHNSIVSDAVAACRYVYFQGSNMLVLPLHHSFAFTAAVVAVLIEGSEICINKSLKNVLTDMVKYKPHNMFLVPLFVETFYKKIWESAKKKGKDKMLKKLVAVSDMLLKVGIDLRRTLFKSILQAFGGNLKLIVCGGAPLDATYVKGLRSFGINVLNGYGITECSPVVSVNRNNYYRDGSVGLVLPGVDVKIEQPNEYGHGEIYVKGDIIMLGYYRNEQATKDTFDSEWFKTGDLGFVDADGFLYVTGRIKNLIILSNGKNISPEELELELLNIPLIKEIIVRQEISAKGCSDVIIAEIFPDNDVAVSQGADNIKECIDQAIADFNKNNPPYKRIQRIILRDVEFPKTTTKKIKRNRGV